MGLGQSVSQRLPSQESPTKDVDRAPNGMLSKAGIETQYMGLGASSDLSHPVSFG